MERAWNGFSFPLRSLETIEDLMRRWLADGAGRLPSPANGQTRARWRALAQIGARDLSLAKIFESHVDAQAILDELQADYDSSQLLAVWAAEMPSARVTAHRDGARLVLSGLKAWCSGAAAVDAAIVTVWSDDSQPLLALVSMNQSGVSIERGGWQTSAMASADTIMVRFEDAEAIQIGEPGDYLHRPGFWHGGAGIAAVWFGAAVAIGEELGRSSRVVGNPFAAAHLGAIDLALSQARALLSEAADWIDAQPAEDAQAVALRVRGAVEAAALEVMNRVEKALGPSPLCADAEHAQRCQDLRIFLRQSHAEADLAELGRLINHKSEDWKL